MKRNARVKPKRESYADWMKRVDAEVEEAARKIKRQPPTYAWLQRVPQPQVSAELRERMKTCARLAQKLNGARTEWMQLQTRLTQQRDELLKLEDWVQQETESIRRELHLDCES